MKIVSINVENKKHLARVREFLAKEKADVVCLMEAVEGEVKDWMKLGYGEMIFAPNDVLDGVPTGVAIMSKPKLEEREIFYAGEEIGEYLAGKQKTHCPVVVKARIGEVVLGAVHFSWTADGEADERQRVHLAKLFAWTGEREMVLCGDFNIPRGRELYYQLVQKWKDNIPTGVTTTIDPDLHRANKTERGKLALVVDYVWSCLPAGRQQPKYSVKNVRVVSGISDHCGVVAEVDVV